MVPLYAEFVRPRARVEELINARISLGRDLLSRSITSDSELRQAVREFNKWDDYNRDLLRQVFTTDEMARRYVAYRAGFALDISSAPLSAKVQSLQEVVQEKLDNFATILGRFDLIEEMQAMTAKAKSVSTPNPQVFIVHGHDKIPKLETTRLVENQGLEAIILAEQPNSGRTLIEKFEQSTASVIFAIVLLTPDDIGVLRTAPDEEQERARENVIFELGYFVAKLGRGKVCLVKKGNVNIFSDLAGVAYVDLDKNGAWKANVLREMKAAGIAIDMNLLT